VFAALRRDVPSARLIRVGGAFSATQIEMIHQMALPCDSVVVLPFLNREELAAVYRRATLVTLPSEAEGFGFPVLEAMACGTPVVVSDIPALREVGGTIATYCEVGSLSSWVGAILRLIGERRDSPEQWVERVVAGVRWAGCFTWKAYAERAVQLYKTTVTG